MNYLWYYLLRSIISTKKINKHCNFFITNTCHQVIEEIRQDYPDYIVIGDPSISRSASVASRYSDESLRGIVLDIILLARSDHLVCTFSSQVCRVAYEIMQTMHTDASDR